MNYQVKIKGNEDNIEKTWDLIHFLSIQHGMKEETADVFAVAVGEAYNNAITYSSNSDMSELTLNFQKDVIIAEIINFGDFIDFDNIQKFEKDQDFMQYSEGKLGIPLIKTLVDDVKYERKNGKNKIILIKNIETKE